jgi:DNA-binding Lrp family transcriptional regulator
MTYENLDEKLINALLDDGRASLRSLAERLDVSVTTVSNHLSDLEDRGVIRGTRRRSTTTNSATTSPPSSS